VFKVVERLSGNWRALNGGETLMTLVLEGCVFKDGILQPTTWSSKVYTAA